MQSLEKAFNSRNKKINKIEKIKELKSPQEAFNKISQYAKEGYDSIPDEDKSYFLKCFGIYDRAKTPKQFMIKLRIPGGQLNATQAQAIGECAKEFGRDYLDLTTRAQCELRYIDIQNIPTILKKLQDTGLDPYQTGVDNIRGIVGDPFDEVGFDNILPSQKLLLKLQQTFLYDPNWISALPRKFNTSITGSMANRCNAFGNDCCFVLAIKDGIYGYNMYLGGRVGYLAQNADIFLQNEDEVLKAFEAITTIFKKYGFRDNRNKNRLQFLIQAVGMKEISKAIRTVSGIDFLTAGETLTKMDYVEPDNGKVQLKDGTNAIHIVVPSGIFKGSSLIKVAQLSKEFGDERLRFDMEQSIYILGVKDTTLILKDKFFDEYKNINTPYFNHLIACAGTEHCPFGVIENKNDAIEMASYLDKKVPLEKGRVRMYWSACVKGCGVHGLGDIGFEGCKAKLDGQSVSGVHIYLGGKLINGSQEGHTVIKSAPLTLAKSYIESLMLEYKRLRISNEPFEQFYDRVLTLYSNAYIGFMMKLLAYLRKNNIDIEFGFNKKNQTNKIERFELFDLGDKLYYAITKSRPYSSIVNFTHTLQSEQYIPIKDFDTNINIILERILTHKEGKRALVFSEIVEFIE